MIKTRATENHTGLSKKYIKCQALLKEVYEELILDTKAKFDAQVEKPSRLTFDEFYLSSSRLMIATENIALLYSILTKAFASHMNFLDHIKKNNLDGKLETTHIVSTFEETLMQSIRKKHHRIVNTKITEAGERFAEVEEKLVEEEEWN